MLPIRSLGTETVESESGAKRKREIWSSCNGTELFKQKVSLLSVKPQ